MNKSYFQSLLVILSVFFIIGGCVSTKTPPSARGVKKLVWSEEFNYTGLPDTSKWGYDLGNGCPNICGWGNNELEYYTANRSKNARVENGCLVIEAHQEKMGGQEYTSARLASKHKGDWKYGRIEVRAKLPKGRGTWAAIWMLPTHWEYGGWPRSGEIDIMEFVGFMPDSVFGTVHTEKFNGMLGTQVTGGVQSTTLDAKFHDYALEWNAEKIDFFIDGNRFQTFQNRQTGIEAWPFDRDFHVLLNLAVGGNWGGKMGVDPTIWPQQFLVDYVRVYQ